MSNEIIAISVPQVEDDIDIFEEVRTLLATRGFVFIDMRPEFEMESILYRFQRKDK